MPATNARLNAVSCVSATVCAAVGEIGNSSPTFKTYAESRSGAKWSVAPSSGPAGSELLGVSCVAADWCQAVGESDNLGTLLTEHWDGHTWSQVASPVPSSSYLNGVSCTSRAWCVAVGSRVAPHQVATVVERWYGTKWSTVSSPNRDTNYSYLWGVSCVSPSWCAAVGESFKAAGVGSQTLVEMWNGKTWRIVPSPSLPNELNHLASVDCVSSTWCIAVGNTETGGLIERWDGHTWTIVAHPSAHQESAGFEQCGVCVAHGMHGRWLRRRVVERTRVVDGRLPRRSVQRFVSDGHRLQGRRQRHHDLHEELTPPGTGKNTVAKPGRANRGVTRRDEKHAVWPPSRVAGCGGGHARCAPHAGGSRRRDGAPRHRHASATPARSTASRHNHAHDNDIRPDHRPAPADDVLSRRSRPATGHGHRARIATPRATAGPHGRARSRHE